MSLIEDALLTKLMEANTPFMVIPSESLKKKKKKPQDQFDEDFINRTKLIKPQNETYVATRLQVDPRPG